VGVESSEDIKKKVASLVKNAKEVGKSRNWEGIIGEIEEGEALEREEESSMDGMVGDGFISSIFDESDEDIADLFEGKTVNIEEKDEEDEEAPKEDLKEDLEEVEDFLTGEEKKSEDVALKKGRGRPKGSKNKSKKINSFGLKKHLSSLGLLKKRVYEPVECGKISLKDQVVAISIILTRKDLLRLIGTTEEGVEIKKIEQKIKGLNQNLGEVAKVLEAKRLVDEETTSDLWFIEMKLNAMVSAPGLFSLVPMSGLVDDESEMGASDEIELRINFYPSLLLDE